MFKAFKKSSSQLTQPTQMKVVIITMDTHLASAAERAQVSITKALPGTTLTVFAASEFAADQDALQACIKGIESAHIVLVTMLFLEEHFLPIMAALTTKRDNCDAMICALSAAPVTKLTRIGGFSMDKSSGGVIGLLKKLKPKAATASADKESPGKNESGEKQLKVLRILPKLLKFIPGAAQDVRIYFLCLQYWLAGSEANIAAMVQLVVSKYANGERKHLQNQIKAAEPVEYPEVGLYHPKLLRPDAGNGPAFPGGLITKLSDLPKVATTGKNGTVGILLMRSYLLAGNAGHYDGVITALEAEGMKVLPAFASGLDARKAIETYFIENGVTVIDALVSLTGFSLVGGPAYNDSRAAEVILSKLDVPYFAATPVEFQTLDQWEASDRGLLPVESTMMVAIPELDGATGSVIFGGRSEKGANRNDMTSHTERASVLANRVAKYINLRRSDKANRKVAAVLFNFPPNASNTGTAAFLSVFESLYNLLSSMKDSGYSVEMPASVDELRQRIIYGNAEKYGAMANVHKRILTDDHVRAERWLAPIEKQWGPAPGNQLSDGASIFILGERFGNVFVGIQPGFGTEGDPMRLLFDKGSSPTHAFSAFYRFIKEDFAADAIVHFGTHGALEFMPGKQVGLCSDCWPDRLIGNTPNIYLYAANNPSEGAVAKRRSAATLISYLTPSLEEAGLYKGLIDLKSSIERYRSLEPEAIEERSGLLTLIQVQASELELVKSEPAWAAETEEQQAKFDSAVLKLHSDVLELEYTLIPHGLHVMGGKMSAGARGDMLLSVAEGSHGRERTPMLRKAIEMITSGSSVEQIAAIMSGTHQDDIKLIESLINVDNLLQLNSEIEGLLNCLDGRFIKPAPGGDLLRTPEILPTGRNLHGFDPFRIPSAFAVSDGRRQAQRLLDKHCADGNGLPKTIAMVLWGTDNLKSEGAPIAQALALLGALPRFDSYGRLAGAMLIPLEELQRPRIDVVITLSGIFRDLLPLQIKLLAEACFLAASADEPSSQNYVRANALSYQAKHGCDLETASLRVFGNAEGAYGANVNLLIDCASWDNEDEIADTYTKRKGFAYGKSGMAVQQSKLLNSMLANVDMAFQNLESAELGVTTVDTYFDTLGGITRAVSKEKKRAGESNVEIPVYIGDQTRGKEGSGTVRTLSEQVSLETRTRTLNPKWYEGMLEHGFEGVRQIEQQLTNTLGWSATTGQVQPWVYQQMTQTFMLDPEMRNRLAALNPAASAKFANRLLEASERNFWQPDSETLAALRRAGEELEDRLEGVFEPSETSNG